jgi:hypothetical protein
MPLSETIVKPKKRDGTLAWKGSPEMKMRADTDCWDAFLEFIDDLEEYTAQDMMTFVSEWYLHVGYSNLGKMIMQANRAIAKQKIAA